MLTGVGVLVKKAFAFVRLLEEFCKTNASIISSLEGFKNLFNIFLHNG